MPGGWWSAAVVGVICGGALTLLLTSLGLAQLAREDAATTLLRSNEGLPTVRAMVVRQLDVERRNRYSS